MCGPFRLGSEVDLESCVVFLREWKEVVGAIIGGLLGVVGAMVVARDARQREDRAAAIAVMAPLLDLRGHYFAAKKSAEGIAPAPANEDDATLRLGVLIAAYPLSFPESFSRAAERVSVVHPHIAAHLALINMRWATVRIALHRLSQDSDYAGTHPGERLRRDRGDMVMDARTLISGLRGIGNDAACVIVLLQRLVESRFRAWYQLKMWLFPDAVGRQCREALRRGEYQVDMPEN
jgi:hypothetical protein